MSVDSGTGTASDARTGIGCALCTNALDPGDDLVVQCYAEDDHSLPAESAADGFVGVCSDCATEVDELLAAWNSHEEPPVGADRSIAAGYREVADDCSFCDRTLGEDPLLGVEYVQGVGGIAERAGDDADYDDAPESTDYANYSLCAGCVPVFDEFLQGVGDDSSA